MSSNLSAPAQASPLGRIVTFYSYKGGTGRSMALANVAWILAWHGKRVLCVDWDLEAPGLHRYFAPFLADPKLEETDGLIDWVYDYLLASTEEAQNEHPAADHDPSPWYDEFAQLDRYAVSLNGDFPKGGSLYLLGAGRQNASFSERVNRFNWVRFYEEFGGESFVTASFENARRFYDYILVDSRTGVADTSGVSTIQVPDDLVVAFTLNNQSIFGAANVARNALELRSTRDKLPATEQPARPFRVFPLVTRVELAEDRKLKERRKLVREQLDGVTYASDKKAYFGEMEVLYVPYYAYDEVLAAISEEAHQSHSLLGTYVRLISHLTNGVINQPPAISSAKRAELLRRYDRTEPAARKQERGSTSASRYDVFISASPQDESIAKDLYSRLRSYGHPFLASMSLSPGDDRDAEIHEALNGCRTHVIVLGSSTPIGGPWLAEEVRVALQRAEREGIKIVPIFCNRDSQGLPEPYSSLARLVVFRFPEVSLGEIAAAVARTLGVDALDVESLERRTLDAEARSATLNRTKAAAEQRYRVAFTVLVGVVLSAVVMFIFGDRRLRGQDESIKELDEKLNSTRIEADQAQRRVELLANDVAARSRWLLLLDKANRAATELQRLDASDLASAANGHTDPEIREFAASVRNLEGTIPPLLNELEEVLQESKLDAEAQATLGAARDALKEREARLADLLEAKATELSKTVAPTPEASAQQRAEKSWRDGYNAYLEGNYDEAKRAYRDAISMDPKYAPAYNSLGRLQLDDGDTAAALQTFQKAIDYDASYAPAYNNLAVANLRLARAEAVGAKSRERYLEVARSNVLRALKLRPNFPEAEHTRKSIERLGPRPAVKGTTMQRLINIRKDKEDK